LENSVDSYVSTEISLPKEAGCDWLRTLNDTLKRAAALPVFHTTAILSLLMLAVYSDRFWGARVPVVLLSVYGLAYRQVLMSYTYWFAITLVMMLASLTRAYEIDNHKVLTVYWCLVMTLTMARPVASSLRFNARMLIGFCFGMSVVWKLISPDFMSGAFFEHTLLLDDRFREFLIHVTGMGVGPVAANAGEHAALVSGEISEMYLRTTPLVENLAWGMAVWTILIESLIAVAFLAPPKTLLYRVRNVSLILFMLTTYPVATVIGFGWLLCVMGFAQCRSGEWRSRLGYLATMGILQLFLIPWGSVLELTVRLY
jgi:hypothetical protein